MERVRLMNHVTTRRPLYFWLSITLLLCGIVSWMPYLAFKIQEPYGLLTLIINPVGMILGILSAKKWVALSNLIMIFSIFPVAIFVYLTKGYIPM